MSKKKKAPVRRIEHDLFGSKEAVINSKEKGNVNERNAAKWLFKWTGVKFTRTPSSGGMRWQDTANVCGDLVCEVANFFCPFAFETKHLKRIYISQKLKANSGVYTIFMQAMEDATRAKKLPFALLRENGMPAGVYYVVLSGGLIIDYLKDKCPVLAHGIVPAFAGYKETPIILLDSNEFLSIDYKEFFNFIKTTYEQFEN